METAASEDFFFSLHHFIYQPSEPWLQGLSLEQPS